MLPDKHAEDGGSLRLPTGPLVLLGALCLFGLTAEASAADWSGVYLQRAMNASEGVAGLAVPTFTAHGGRQARGRSAEHLARFRSARGRRRGPRDFGLGLALAVQIPAVAIVGFGLMGMGLAAVVPTLFRAAGSQPGIPASVGIAAVSTIGYAGGLIGPPVIGTVASVATLRVALVIILAMLAVVIVGSRRALARSGV